MGDRDGQYDNYTYTRDGTPLQLVMPSDPGEYEIRYPLRQDAEVIARKPITVGAVQASLSAPDAAPAGSLIPVSWTGPGYSRDFVSIARPGDRDGERIAQTNTDDGADLMVEAPMQPGTYELRYVLRQDSTVLVRRPIEITPVTAILTAPATAPAGGPLAVTWDGPGYPNDRILLAESGTRAGASVKYANTRDGQTVEVIMPATPGTYELQYLVRGKPVTVLARQDIVVTPVTASITAPGSAKAGDFVQVAWDGPGYNRDAIVFAEADGGRDLRRFQIRGANPVEIPMPNEPGSYELRYLMAEGRTVLATIPLEVTE